MVYHLCVNRPRTNYEEGDRGGARINDALSVFAVNEYREIPLFWASRCAHKGFSESAYRYLNFSSTRNLVKFYNFFHGLIRSLCVQKLSQIWNLCTFIAIVQERYLGYFNIFHSKSLYIRNILFKKFLLSLTRGICVHSIFARLWIGTIQYRR